MDLRPRPLEDLGMKPLHVLVTGAHGYIGVPLCATLIERGHHVLGLDTGFYDVGWLDDGRSYAEPPCQARDIRRVTEDDLRGLDAVIHLGELSNDPLGELLPEATYSINYRGSVSLAQKAKAAGVPRFLYSSSCSVYGFRTTDELLTEESPVSPQTVYAECKVKVEQALAGLADGSFSPTSLRNATAYGPSPRMRFDLVVNNLAGLAWTTGEIRMISDGSPYRPLIHVLDICQAFARTLEAPREHVHNQVFNVGETRENYRIREVAGIVADVFPDCRLTLGDNADQRSYRVSFEKIHEHLPEFRGAHDVASGVRQLRGVFERVALTHEIFEFRAHTRVKQLTHLMASGQIDGDFFWTAQPAAART